MDHWSGSCNGPWLAVAREIGGDPLPSFVLKLYIAGSSPRADVAIANLKRICENDLQGQYTLDIIDVCHARGKPVAVGGPGVTSSPHFYQTADFRVLGEAESVIGELVQAWEAGSREEEGRR